MQWSNVAFGIRDKWKERKAIEEAREGYTIYQSEPSNTYKEPQK